MDLNTHLYNYNHLKKGIKIENDQYGIFNYQKEEREKTFKANPNLNDFDKPYLYLYQDGDIPIGRCYYFETKFKCNKDTLPALSASSLEVQANYRHFAVGADIIATTTFSDAYDYRIFSGISPMALPMYKKLRYQIFEIPVFIMRTGLHNKLEEYGIHGIVNDIISYMSVPFFKYKIWLNGKTNKLKKEFIIEKVQKVPKWVDSIVLNDGHRFMEIHDHLWFQWNLDNHFNGNSRNTQSFYIITKNKTPLGFFMTKERCINKNNAIVGSIVEWGIANEKLLSESDLYKLALETFNNNVSIFTIATTSKETANNMKKCGFFRNGTEHILFKSNNKIEGSEDVDNWRLRLGYADTILS